MAAELFNSMSGYSVDIPPKTVIDGNANVVTNVNYPQGNVTANVVYANVYKFANGTNIPLIPPGSNAQVIFNDEGALAGNANFLFDKNSNELTVGTVLANSVSAQTVTAFTVFGDELVSRSGPITISATGTDQSIVLSPTGDGVIDASGAILANISDPVNFTDAATKQYVDSVATGLIIKDACDAATTASISSLTSGGIVVYNNGAGGIGASLNLENPLFNIDGVSMSNGKRVLVKNEANLTHNGIYVWETAVKLVRATDFDRPLEIRPGAFTYISGGAIYNGTGWVQTNEIFNVGSDPISWTQFSGYTTYSAGTGLTLANTTFSISNTSVTSGSYGNSSFIPTFTVNPQGQLTQASSTHVVVDASTLTGTTLSSNVLVSSLTTVGVLTHLNVSGNINAGNVNSNFFGSGSGLSSLNGANVTGAVGNATHATNADHATSANVANTVLLGSQPNIVSVGTLTSLTVSGNASSNYFHATNNISAKVFESTVAQGTAPLTVLSNTLVGNLNANLLNGHTTSTAAVPNTIVLRDANGNVAAGNVVVSGNLVGNVQGNISGNIQAAGANGEVQFNQNNILSSSANLFYNAATNTLEVKNQLIANSFQIGYSGFKFSNTTIYAAYTSTATPEYELWSIDANVVSAIDFMIISSDEGAGGPGSPVIRRQISKITSMVLGNVVDYAEISKLDVNGLTGNYSVSYDESNNKVRLLFTSFVSSNSVMHNIQITSVFAV